MSAPPKGMRHHRLFIDFNGTIHEAIREVPKKNDQEHMDDFEDRIMIAAVERLVMRCKLLSPEKLLYVAVDGVPPRAKMQQQRYRRFASTWIKRQQEHQEESQPWDSNAITPGTRFMARMNDYLHAVKNDVRDRVGVENIIISGPDEEGEGEQKIFNFLRGNADANCVDIVYGMDADLILQALLYTSWITGDKDDIVDGGLWIVREEDDARRPHQKDINLAFIDARRLLWGIEKRFKCSADDFALLCVFIGNDFVPRLPSISVQDNGIEALMSARDKVLQEAGASAIVNAKTYNIDMRLLTRIVEILAQSESEAMDNAEKRHSDMQRKVMQRGGTRTASIIEDLPLMFPFPRDVIQPSRPGWRPRYHHHVLHLDASGADSASELSTICMAYVQGVIWSYRYTAQVCLSKTWHYPFIAAPTATDLHNFMLCHPDARDVDSILAKLDEENQELLITDPVLQLLTVLPPQSSHLLPNDGVRALMHDVRCGVLHMYPTAFDFSKYLKYKTWECHPVLPRVDVADLKRALYDRPHEIGKFLMNPV